jgi:AraC-like DNA-binding protein
MAQRIKNIPNRIIIPKACRERFLPLALPGLQPLRACGVDSAGLSDLVAPFHIGRKAPPFHVAIFTLSGKARWQSRDGAGAFAPGELWFGPARQNYAYQAVDRWRCVWFHLQDSDRWHAYRKLPLGSRASDSGQRIAAAVEGLLTESSTSRPGAARALRAYAEVVAVLLDRELQPKDSHTDQGVARNLATLWQRVGDDLQHPWRVEELAARLHVSVVHFHRLVARHERSSPLAIITRLRIQSAAEMLLQSDYKLHHIAQAVGYETPFSLSRAFKQQLGVSPHTFRSSRERTGASHVKRALHR